jgi:glycosyltransferase involved in cell wall biosynthesis
MKILFIHQNFPGQFKHLAPILAQHGHTVVAMTLQKKNSKWQGVQLIPYEVNRATTETLHPWLQDFETKTIRAEACFRTALQLKKNGFTPDIIIAHHGWGESLFLKDVWPKVKMGIYCEFFYNQQGYDVGFDPEFSSKDIGDPCKLQLKNINNLLHLEVADAGISPTFFQANSFPDRFRSQITVVHDGIDTNVVTPHPKVSLTLNSNLVLTRKDEVLTFVSRDLEPYRGYHIFMRALPEILKRRPNARILIVGGDGVSYGSFSQDGRKWKDIFIEEVRCKISDKDWERVHFLGKIPYELFTAVLQLSTVHLYLTYPFVLSWSLLEAMSIGCAIIASDTQPLHEAIHQDETGRLVDFFDVQSVIEEVCRLLADPETRNRLGTNARAFLQQRYDLHNVCLPEQLKWVKGLAES